MNLERNITFLGQLVTDLQAELKANPTNFNKAEELAKIMSQASASIQIDLAILRKRRCQN